MSTPRIALAGPGACYPRAERRGRQPVLPEERPCDSLRSRARSTLPAAANPVTRQRSDEVERRSAPATRPDTRLASRVLPGVLLVRAIRLADQVR